MRRKSTNCEHALAMLPGLSVKHLRCEHQVQRPEPQIFSLDEAEILNQATTGMHKDFCRPYTLQIIPSIDIRNLVHVWMRCQSFNQLGKLEVTPRIMEVINLNYLCGIIRGTAPPNLQHNQNENKGAQFKDSNYSSQVENQVQKNRLVERPRSSKR